MILLAITLPSSSLLASDLAKEKRWSDQVVDSIIDGKAIWLEANGTKFLGIYTENQAEKALGAAIVLHGIGVHPDWPDVVQPVRTELPKYGWSTLSIQMPILVNEADRAAYDAVFPEVPGRLDAAVKYLQKQGIRNIVLIGHSLGAEMASSYLAQGGKPISALVTIGPQIDTVSKNDFLGFIRQIKQPVLDIYGSQDLEKVLNSSTDRALAARKGGNQNYRQIMVTGANHFFQGAEAELVRHIKSWLSKHAGVSVRMENKEKP
jgi:pimeloyl-ACP methyl ester carboxylesterase